jgi:hypothetical protein
MTERREPSYADLVYDVVRSAEQPLTFQEIFDRVSMRRPIATKNPKGTIRGTLTGGRQLVNLGDGRYGYLPHLVNGSLLRLPLTEKKPAKHPLIFTDELRQALWPSFHEIQKRQDRRPVQARLPNGAETILSLDFLGTGTWGSTMPEPLRQLLAERRAAAGDSLLIRMVGGEPTSCEISLEPRRQRNTHAIAARNLALADAAAQLYRERGSVQVFLWDLVILLLARGAYRSDVAPDPLDTVLRGDSRFEYSGYRGWVLTETMTPAMVAEIRHNQVVEQELLSIISGELKPVEPDVPPPFGRLTLERSMADITTFLDEAEPASLDEMNALLQNLLSTGTLPRRTATTPLEQAQDVMYDAWEAASSRERVRLAKRAIEISEDCADAYVLLAEETARTPQAAAKLYAQGVAAGERALGQEIFKEAVGGFWGILETRPYMRARLGLAMALEAMGECQTAIGHLQDMLRLNPGDNQGVRYVLLIWLLEHDDDALQHLLDMYPDDASAIWTYGSALNAFRREGDTAASRRLRTAARKWNPHVPAYLSGRKRLPRRLPELIGMGDESEAVNCAAEQMELWRETPGALVWLNSGPR